MQKPSCETTSPHRISKSRFNGSYASLTSHALPKENVCVEGNRGWHVLQNQMTLSLSLWMGTRIAYLAVWFDAKFVHQLPFSFSTINDKLLKQVLLLKLLGQGALFLLTHHLLVDRNDMNEFRGCRLYERQLSFSLSILI